MIHNRNPRDLTPRNPLSYRDGRPEDWRDSASCRGLPTDDFIPDGSGHVVPEQVFRICAACPVAQACFDFALRMDIRDGVWGGSSPNMRRRAKPGDVAPALRPCTECGGPLDRPRAATCRGCMRVRRAAADRAAREANQRSVA